MMLFTHLLVGLLVGLGATAVGGGPGVLVAGLLGGLLPDLDMFADHRRTLHFPVGFGVVGLPLVAAGVVLEATAVLTLGTHLVAAWCHSVMDVFGAGRELRPWDRTSANAVYNHALGRWHAPRRLVYDGSPGDLGLALGIAALAVAVGGPLVDAIAIALALPAAVYASVRRTIAHRIPDEYESLSPFFKAQVRALGRRIRG